MATSSKRTYAIPTPRAPVPVADHCRPEPPQDMLKHSSVSVSVGSLGPGVHKVCFSPLSISGCSGTGFDSQCKFAPATVLLLMVERSDRMWSTREGNGKPLQYSGLLLLLPPIFSSMRVFSNESALHIRWPKYWRQKKKRAVEDEMVR